MAATSGAWSGRAHGRLLGGEVGSWYAPIGSRSKTAIAGLGVLDGYGGYLVRDDYAGWHQFDAQLAGVQQCAAHLTR